MLNTTSFTKMTVSQNWILHHNEPYWDVLHVLHLLRDTSDVEYSNNISGFQRFFRLFWWYYAICCFSFFLFFFFPFPFPFFFILASIKVSTGRWWYTALYKYIFNMLIIRWLLFCITLCISTKGNTPPYLCIVKSDTRMCSFLAGLFFPHCRLRWRQVPYCDEFFINWKTESKK